MTSGDLLTLALALINVVQVVLLALITGKQRTMAHDLDGHLSKLERNVATPQEIGKREAG